MEFRVESTPQELPLESLEPLQTSVRSFDLPKLPSLLSASFTLWTGDLTTPLLTLYLLLYPLVIRPNSASLS